MKKVIYIHGLHSSSKESSKFEILTKHFENIEAFDWSIEDDNIQHRLRQLAHSLSNVEEDIVIIGDSTGANFAIQLREMLTKENKYAYAKLVLISPLFAVEDMYDSSKMPPKISKQLIDVNRIEDALIFMSSNDEVVKHKSKTKLKNLKIQTSTDGHSMQNFAKHITSIENYINSMHI